MLRSGRKSVVVYLASCPVLGLMIAPSDSLPSVGWAGRIASIAGRRLHAMVESATSMESIGMVLAALLVIGLEVPLLGFEKSTLARLLRPTRTLRTDIAWFVATMLGLSSLIAACFSLGLTVVVANAATKYLDFGVLNHVTNSALHVLLYLVATDFVGYWVHRISHRTAWWWELHKLHHSATELNVLTTTRNHPLDTAAIAMAKAVPFAILGGSAGESLAMFVILGMHACLSHSMLPWSWGWFGKYVVRSPIGHRIHHSPLAEHFDMNFAGVFPVWDWMFGTLYTGDVVNETVGVDANYHNVRGLPYDVLESTRRAFAIAKNSFRRANRSASPAAEGDESVRTQEA
jgi:sterol desaturase/sphingolipid hydroxylase (fatty acid hydroxylase superfamily)